MSSSFNKEMGRRGFLSTAAGLMSLPIVEGVLAAEKPDSTGLIIDDHQHTDYSATVYWPRIPGRNHADLIVHQRNMGVIKTILLPAGPDFMLGLPCGGNDSVVTLAREHPEEFAYFANEDPRLPGAQQTLEKYLKAGAIGIGEQKFPVDCDSPAMHKVAEVAQEFGVPILLHFEDDDGTSLYCNMHLERFHTMLERYPSVVFLGHAQSWWANLDARYQGGVSYPKGPITPGGLTERLLSNYPNVYGDLSAGSGLNALLRDEDYTRDFLKRFQDRLTFGSDCSDPAGHGQTCVGWNIIQAVRRLAEPAVSDKILRTNTLRIHQGRLKV